jgi:hypothetical protein
VGTIVHTRGWVGLRAGLEEPGKSYPDWFEPLTIQHIANCYLATLSWPVFMLLFQNQFLLYAKEMVVTYMYHSYASAKAIKKLQLF